MMLERLQNIISQYVEVDPSELTEETQLIGDLGINSYDLVSMIGVVEEEFDIEIPDRDIMDFVTLGDVINYINDKVE